MTKTKALRLDKKGSFYADLDEESDCYGVFGSESTFCYELVADKQTAKDLADKMNKVEP